MRYKLRFIRIVCLTCLGLVAAVVGAAIPTLADPILFGGIYFEYVPAPGISWDDANVKKGSAALTVPGRVILPARRQRSVHASAPPVLTSLSG
jgi:hypothetical protein